jgi:rSAM/selenodomain-associated transferase 2
MSMLAEGEICLSIIVPFLDERCVLPDLLAQLETWCKAPGIEVILVDGGSTDGSTDYALKKQELMDYTLLSAQQGRARQMNAGAAVATGALLLFLHADTRLPSLAPTLFVTQLLQRLQESQKVWGRFDVSISGKSFMFCVIAFFINWRSRLSGIATGDQAIFVRRDVFDRLAGFPDQALMEDVELSSRLLALSRPLCLSEKVITSGRRWEKRGLWRTMFLMWRLRVSYFFGVPAAELAKRYR